MSLRQMKVHICIALGGGFELALACEFLVVEESSQLMALEVMGGMIPVAGGLQRLAERIGRACAIRMVMLSEPISGSDAAARGIATHAVPTGALQQATTELGMKLSNGPTRAYAAIKCIMKVWSPGVAAADLLMPDVVAVLYESDDVVAATKEVVTWVKSSAPRWPRCPPWPLNTAVGTRPTAQPQGRRTLASRIIQQHAPMGTSARCEE
jgi:enoyl-CoA hydratase/carnithine racemase